MPCLPTGRRQAGIFMLNLTRQERGVILFLIGMALVGMGFNFLIKKYVAVRTFVCANQDMGKVDLNKADKEMLIDIPGIGEKLAQRIIEYRRQQGDFKEIEELKKIKGITNYRYEKLKDTLCIK